TAQGPAKTIQLRDALQYLCAAIFEMETSSEYKTYVRGVIAHLRTLSATKLTARQHKTQYAPMVWHHGCRLLKVPTCENELVALYMKMEAKGYLPFECQVIEYTSRDGIDEDSRSPLARLLAFCIYISAGTPASLG